MRVLHLSDTPLSGAPFRLMQVQRMCGIDARLISHRGYYSTSSPVCYETDILLQDDQKARKNVAPTFDRNEIKDLFINADVFHFHNFFKNQRIFQLFPELFRYLKGKKVVFQVHSQRNALIGIEENLRNPDIHEKLVIAQYHTRQYPNLTIVPNAVPVHDYLHTPIYRPEGIPIISYSPSNTNLKFWNDKGQSEVHAAVAKLRHPHTFLEITHTPHRDCLRKKQKAHLAIDEVMTGSYHMCTLEALSMGQLVLGNIDTECQYAVKEVTGGPMFPHLACTKDNLASRLDDMVSPERKGFVNDMQVEARKWMLAYWNEEHITNIFRGVYER